jgi:hypothetical protein
VLILANEAIGDEMLLREIRHHIEGRRSEVKVMAPTLVKSGLDVLTGDVDDERADASRRVEASIAALEGSGIQASGTVGEADPNVALEDGLRVFPADEVVIVAHPRERAAWAEHDVVEQARRRLTIPITYIEADPDAPGPAVRDVKGVAPAGRRVGGEDDARVDREAAETFPASDPPAKY